MSSTAASGFVFLLLSVQVIQSQDGWGVTYSYTKVCAVKGSTVYISCSYTYPSRIKRRDITNRFWFTKEKDGEPVDLMTDSEYSGRVRYECDEKRCFLIIRDLRESDSAEYKFMFTTNQPEDKYTGSPGVTLSLPGVQVKVSRSDSNKVNLTCLSSYVLPDDPSYIWYKDGEKINTGPSSSYSVSFSYTDSYSCAIRGHENHRSPPVYAPKLLSVSVSPSAEIVEGSSVTLTCSSDANPAANYTWNKENQPPLSEEPQLVFSSIQSSDSGRFYCEVENQLGMKRSEFISIDVKYAPKLPCVSVSPSAKIVEGSSVTLTCSSDANPAAEYTWYKEDEDSPKASGQIFIITNFTAEHNGYYSCEGQNTRGRRTSTFHLSVAAVRDPTTVLKEIIRWTLLVVVLISLLLLCLWMRIQSRKKKALISTTEPHEPIEAVELDLHPVYDDIAAQPEDTEEQEDQLDLHPVYDDIAAQPEDTEEQEDQV